MFSYFNSAKTRIYKQNKHTRTQSGAENALFQTVTEPRFLLSISRKWKTIERFTHRYSVNYASSQDLCCIQISSAVKNPKGAYKSTHKKPINNLTRINWNTRLTIATIKPETFLKTQEINPLLKWLQKDYIKDSIKIIKEGKPFFFYTAHNVLLTPLHFQFYFPPPPPPPHLFYKFFHPQIHRPPSTLHRPHITTTISIVFPPRPPPPPLHFYCFALHHHHISIVFPPPPPPPHFYCFPLPHFFLIVFPPPPLPPPPSPPPHFYCFPRKGQRSKSGLNIWVLPFRCDFGPFDLFEGKQ